MVQSPFDTDLPHVEAHFDAVTGTWAEPIVVEDSYVKFHPLAGGLSFGQQCFEGLKAFRNREGNVRIFRPDAHAARLNHSAAYVSLPAVPDALFLKCAKLAVAVNADQVPDFESRGSLYIRPFLAAMTPHYVPLPSDQYVLFVFAAPLSRYLGQDALSALVEEGFDHAAPNGVGSAKLGGNYGPLMRYDAAAKSKGYQTTLHLDALTHSEIEEFGTAGFVGIKKMGDTTTLVVTNNTTSVIQSITVDSCVKIAKHFGWKVEKRAIKFTELPYFDEVVAGGTAASVCSVRKIFRATTNEDFLYLKDHEVAGDVTAQLQTAMHGIQCGDIEDPFGWMVDVKHGEGANEDYSENAISALAHL